jgi:hypothetical protein
MTIDFCREYLYPALPWIAFVVFGLLIILWNYIKWRRGRNGNIMAHIELGDLRPYQRAIIARKDAETAGRAAFSRATTCLNDVLRQQSTIPDARQSPRQQDEDERTLVNG